MNITPLTKKLMLPHLAYHTLPVGEGGFVEIQEVASPFSITARQTLSKKLLSEQKFIELCPLVCDPNNIAYSFEKRKDAFGFIAFLQQHFVWTFHIRFYSGGEFQEFNVEHGTKHLVN